MANAGSTDYSEPRYANGAADKSGHPWFPASIDEHLDEKVNKNRKFFEEYSGIPGDKQSAHIHKIRDEAWAVRAYPCTGLGLFLRPYITTSPAYDRILSILKEDGGLFLDVGCFVGSDMRQLAAAGAPSSNMYGVDIVSHWEIGYSLFNDRDKFNAHFIEADLMMQEATEDDKNENENENHKKSAVAQLDALHGRVQVVSASQIVHQWVWERQVAAAKRLVAFTAGPGALIVGNQVGNMNGAGHVTPGGHDAPVFRHDVASWKRLWKTVGRETGTRWKVDARFLTADQLGWDLQKQSWVMPGDGIFDFVVTRLPDRRRSFFGLCCKIQ